MRFSVLALISALPVFITGCGGATCDTVDVNYCRLQVACGQYGSLAQCQEDYAALFACDPTAPPKRRAACADRFELYLDLEPVQCSDLFPTECGDVICSVAAGCDFNTASGYKETALTTPPTTDGHTGAFGSGASTN